MKYLLDTDTASYFIRDVPGVVSTALRELGNWCISSITYAELCNGLFQTSSHNVEIAVTDFLDGVQVVDFNSHAALEAGRLHGKLRAAGTPIGNSDTLIAAHALSLRLTLVTNNTKHFGKVDGLTLANWVAVS